MSATEVLLVALSAAATFLGCAIAALGLRVMRLGRELHVPRQVTRERLFALESRVAALYGRDTPSRPRPEGPAPLPRLSPEGPPESDPRPHTAAWVDPRHRRPR